MPASRRILLEQTTDSSGGSNFIWRCLRVDIDFPVNHTCEDAIQGDLGASPPLRKL